MPGTDLIFYGTTGPGGSEGDSQPDPADWLGRARSSNVLHDFKSTLTTAQAVRSRHYIVDSTRIGDGEDAHVLKWVLIQSGTNALAAGRVMAFASATGTFKLDRLLGPGEAGIGDDYTVFDVNNVWPDVTAAQASAGDERFRCIALQNEHGSTITNVRVYFVPLELVGDDIARVNQFLAGGFFIERSDDVTDFFDQLGQRQLLGGPDGFAGSGPWLRPYGYGVADTNMASLTNNNQFGIWLRRLIPENSHFRRSVATMVVVESDTTGSDPDPLSSAAIMAFDIEGSDPVGTVAEDRFTYIGGGVRLTGNVLVEGIPLEDRPVRWDIRAGDLGSIFTDDDPIDEFDTTDEDGNVQATLIAPTIQSAAGLVTHPRLIIGAGDEVGDPRPRVSGTVSADYSYDVTATGNLPQSSRQYLDEDGGFVVSQ